MVRRRNKESIRFFIAESPLFIYEDDSLKNAYLKMKRLDVSFLTVVKRDFTILGIINKKDIFESLKNNSNNENKKIFEFIHREKNLLVLYPMSTTFEAIAAMKTLKKKVIPVANNPWDKKFVGVLWLNDVNNFTEPVF